jgi:hypothetical protein
VEEKGVGVRRQVGGKRLATAWERWKRAGVADVAREQGRGSSWLVGPGGSESEREEKT